MSQEGMILPARLHSESVLRDLCWGVKCRAERH